MPRVLIAEGMAPIRDIIAEAMKRDDRIQVVGHAADGIEAVAMTVKLRPDLVALGAKMPRLDSAAVIRQIMTEVPTPVLMVESDLLPNTAELSSDALRAGAVAVSYLSARSDAESFDLSADRFVRLVIAMSTVKVVRQRLSGQATPAPPVQVPQAPSGLALPSCRIVAIAASTGGPAALRAVLSPLPADFRPPILVVQHITGGFVTGLAEWLDRFTALTVKVADEGELLKPHTVYIAPDGRHLGISPRMTVELSDAAPIGGFRPSADYMFRSVAKGFGRTALGLILTGMGRDGVDGLQSLKKEGAQIIAQDEESAVVFGMPGQAIHEGLADHILPLKSIADHLMSLQVR